jgi:hypothetical protein
MNGTFGKSGVTLKIVRGVYRETQTSALPRRRALEGFPAHRAWRGRVLRMARICCARMLTHYAKAI